MVESGFEYVRQPDDMFSYDQYNGRTQLEWAQQFGFGVWTTMSPESSEEAYGQGQMTDWPGDAVNNLSRRRAGRVVGRLRSVPARGLLEPGGSVQQPDGPADHGGLRGRRRERSPVSRCPRRVAGVHGRLGASVRRRAGDVRRHLRRRRPGTDGSADRSSGSPRRGSTRRPTTLSGRSWWTRKSRSRSPTPRAPQRSTRLVRKSPRDLRDDLVAVWQTIDWSLPPVTYEEVVFGDGTIVRGSVRRRRGHDGSR